MVLSFIHRMMFLVTKMGGGVKWAKSCFSFWKKVICLALIYHIYWNIYNLTHIWKSCMSCIDLSKFSEELDAFTAVFWLGEFELLWFLFFHLNIRCVTYKWWILMLPIDKNVFSINIDSVWKDGNWACNENGGERTTFSSLLHDQSRNQIFLWSNIKYLPLPPWSK